MTAEPDPPAPAAAADGPGRDIVRRIAPGEDDLFVISRDLSGFYAANLPGPLPKPGARALILAGMAADIRVPFAAADARRRDHEPWVRPTRWPRWTPTARARRWRLWSRA